MPGHRRTYLAHTDANERSANQYGGLDGKSNVRMHLPVRFCLRQLTAQYNSDRLNVIGRVVGALVLVELLLTHRVTDAGLPIRLRGRE